MIIVDFDNTLANGLWRGVWSQEQSYVWHENCILDDPNRIVKELIEHLPYKYVILTCKPNIHRGTVVTWINKHIDKRPQAIFMRPEGCHDSSVVLKKKVTQCLLKEVNIHLAIDDRLDVCEMYRSLAIPTFHFTYHPQPKLQPQPQPEGNQEP